MTWIEQAAGPVNAGSGDQNILSLDISEALRKEHVNPLKLNGDQLRRLAWNFVPPPHFNDAFELLEQPGSTVLVSGAPGSGRHTAGLMLLRRLPTRHGRLEELTASDADRANRRTDGLEVSEEDRFLLDLSTCGEQEFLAALPGVRDYQHQVAEKLAWLVVVLPDGVNHLVPAELDRIRVELGRPPGRRVFIRHLRGREFEYAPELRELDHPFDQDSMNRLALLAAEFVRQWKNRPLDEFQEWWRRATETMHDHREAVARKVAEYDGDQRAVLLTVALLHGAPADAVSEAIDWLCTELGHPVGEGIGLARLGLVQVLHSVGAKVEDERVRFEIPSFDHAVRAYFWANYRDLREHFGTWAARCVTGGLLSDADRLQVVDRYATAALTAGNPGAVWDNAIGWSGVALLPEAARVIQQGLAHEKHGGLFRLRMREAAADPKSTPALARVLTTLCVDVLADSHPDQAVVRLHHLARRADGDVARTELFKLVHGDRRLYWLLLGRLTSGEVRRSADLGLFLELVDPEVLLTAGSIPWESLRQGWRVVMSESPAVASWAPRAHSWLAAADRSDSLLPTLVAAAEGDRSLLDRLYLVAVDWRPPDGDSRGAVRLRQLIDVAQGLRPLGPGHHNPQEET
ncbi:hypothetical protein [Kitasatospora viridis]|uniref:Uncharacterized protein n=1 Tax=Kitasatospora viridis TaxID=281105 RepID=A0A561UI54_9ACTN|nr:hypothetical protein [Kitasatospora viridis]TWF99035.1 hypothetical protein FHX73_112871 [Kitasatospora viridis]